MQATKTHNRITNKQRFTLVELMVVLIIVGVLIAALAPAFNRLMTGNAVGAAERMISGQLSLARAEAARRRCEVAIVIYDETLPKSSSFRAAYNPDGTTWQWLPGSQETWLPTGAIIGQIVVGAANIATPDPPNDYPLPNTVADITVQINSIDFPAIIFKPNGRLAQNVKLALYEAVILPDQPDNKSIQLLNDKYWRVLEISQYTGRVTFSTVQKP
jgi:prepilin-type N-terminal cleavage/methylation domain-containing protein